MRINLVLVLATATAVGVAPLIILSAAYARKHPVTEVTVEQEAPSRFGPVQESSGGFRLQVERPGNPDVMCFHVSTRIVSDITEELGLSPDSPNKSLLHDLSAIKGVRHVRLRPYEVVVEKAQVFDWKEVQPAVEVVIRVHLWPSQGALNSANNGKGR